MQTIDYDPYSDEVMRDPFPVYARLRAEAPVYYSQAHDCWFLACFEEIWDAARRSDVFSAQYGVAPGQLLRGEIPMAETFLSMDMPRHRQYRALISRPYSKRSVARLEAHVRACVRELLEPLLERGRLCVYRDLANPLATRIIGELVGLEPEDAFEFRAGIERFFRREVGQIGTSPEGAQALAGLFARAEQIVTERAEAGRTDADDHLSAWLRASIDGQPLSVPQICAHVFSMLVTGAEVVPLAVANTAVYLRQHPDQRARVVADPSRVPHAFAESLRYDQPTNLLGRRVVKDVELRGCQLRAGQGVMFLWASANRDEREFEAADRFDIERRPRRSLSYGHGIHKCIGEHLGNLEGRVLLEELLAAAPDYELDGARVRRAYGEFLHGHVEVPIEFEPRS